MKTKTWRQRENAMLAKKLNNLMDKHLWVRGTMGNIYCRTSHFSLAHSKPEREIAVMKRRMGSLGTGQNGENPERWALSFHLLYLCCFLSLFNLEK